MLLAAVQVDVKLKVANPALQVTVIVSPSVKPPEAGTELGESVPWTTPGNTVHAAVLKNVFLANIKGNS